MATRPTAAAMASPTGLPAKQAYAIAAVCLALGLVAGYFFVQPHPGQPALQPPAMVTKGPSLPAGAHPQLTLEQMKQMADVKVSALMEKSKAEPKNAALLVQIGSIYQATHQFKDAAGYFEKALQIEPKNVSTRTELASCLYYSGDADGALRELNQALKYDSTDANSLFNLGMIKYRAKDDPKGAIAAWQQLLKAHPDLDRKPIVEKMIAEAQGRPAGKISE